MGMTEKLIRNRIRCKKCQDVIESTHVHDFKYCKCNSVFVDGGLEYCRYGYPGGEIEDWIEFLAEYREQISPRVSHYGLLLDQTEEPKILGGELSA
jgi:hypothetical protein